MRFISGLSVMFLCLRLFDARQFRSDYWYFQDVDGWLKFHRVPATWQDAELRCHLEGAVLASPTNTLLLATMVDLIKATQSPRRAVFTGIHATFSKGDYSSIEGVPLSEIPGSWAPNEPDNHDNSEECLTLNPDGTIADVQCNATFAYMCYRKRTKDMPAVSECGTIDTEYQLEPETGSCYKYHSVGQTWSRAFMTCAAEGGYLAIANSPAEAQIFKQLFHNSPERSGNIIHGTIVFLGFRYSEQHGDWLTIHQKSLKKSGYDTWAKNEPNGVKNSENHYEGEYCGSIDMGCQELGLNDMWCGFSNTFICEKNPKSLVKAAKEIQEPLDFLYITSTL